MTRSKTGTTKFEPEIRSAVDLLAEAEYEDWQEEEPECCEEPQARVEGTDIMGSFGDVMLAALYSDPILAFLPIPETVKTPLILICGRPWWIWCDRIDNAKPVQMVWVEDRLNP